MQVYNLVYISHPALCAKKPWHSPA